MPSEHRPEDALGGRLALLAPSELDDEQRRIYQRLVDTVVPEAEAAGFVARLDDGRFIGPFNALLRAPRIADGLGRWTAQIRQAGLSEEVRQVIILAVGAAWRAEYEIYAHEAAARTARIPDADVALILAQTEPRGVSAEAVVAYRLTACVLDRRSPSDALYGEVLAAFGAAGVVAILSLIGQYQFISSVLTTFQASSPSR